MGSISESTAGRGARRPPVDGTRELTLLTLEEAHRTFVENIRDISLEEALDPAGGYRSVLGIAKHVAGWSDVYHSYAFEPHPRHWVEAQWPGGLRDRIEPTESYLAEVIGWFDRTYQRWRRSVGGAHDLHEPRPVHWGNTPPLVDIVVMVAGHWTYHAGEANAILAILRQQAWEYTEEVEENHILTAGHGVRPSWMSDEEASAYEDELARRQRQSAERPG
jgi:hypothetical protein